MKFKIHYEINGENDSIIISGESIAEIQAIVKTELQKRSVDINTAWSEKIQ